MDFQKCKKKIQSCSETEDAQLSNLVTLLSKCSGKVTEPLSPKLLHLLLLAFRLVPVL